MPTKLERLLESIDPQRTLDETSARVDRAVNSFGLARARISDWDDFTATMGRFVRHVENTVLRLSPDFQASPQIDWGLCRKMLEVEFGHNGPIAAFEMARTGVEGGLYAVLQAVAKRIVSEYGAQEIAARVGEYWGGLTTDEKLAAAGEYLGKYAHLLPPDAVDGGAAGLWPHFPQVLQQHPHLLQRLRRLPR